MLLIYNFNKLSFLTGLNTHTERVIGNSMIIYNDDQFLRDVDNIMLSSGDFCGKNILFTLRIAEFFDCVRLIF